jgi:hypothetical protein
MSHATPPNRPKSEQRKRGSVYGIRLLPAERAELERRASAAGFRSVADMVRVRCLSARPLRPKFDLAQLVKVETAINRIGSNVNQIAAVANTRDTVTSDQLDKVRASLEEVYRLINGLYPER